MPDRFADSTAHLLAELERVDLRVRSRVAQLRRVQSEDEHFRGLYISEQEIDALLERPLGAPHWHAAAGDGDEAARTDAALRRLEARLGDAARHSREAGIDLRLPRLAATFGLSGFDVEVVLLCLAVELDLRYERLYAYLQDDVTKKRPSVDLAIQLLASAPAARLAERARFHATAPLVAHQLVELLDDAAQPNPPLLARSLKLDGRIVDFLLGGDAIDPRLAGVATVDRPRRSLDHLRLADTTRASLRRAWPAPSADAAGAVLLLEGRPGAGRRSVAAGSCAEQGWSLLAVDLGAWPDALDAVLGVARIEREAALQAAAVLWHGTLASAAGAASGRGGDDAGEAAAPPRPSPLAVLRAIDAGRAPCIWAADDLDTAAATLARRGTVRLAVPEPTAEERAALWAHALAGAALDADVDLAALGGRFKLTPGHVVRAAAHARRFARLRAGDAAPIAAADLHGACRLQSSANLASLARKSTPRQRWSDIVLPADRLAQLREICNQVVYRDRVYGDWGFGRKLALGKGLAVLFAGPSGTGKTMSAGIIAAELGLDLYKIDLSNVVSKYIGETEKNLARIFDEAETANAILFFDEADALFGKRSEVRDSHDRYANIEVGYLLQRMEEYEGVAILATNFRKNMDDAFVRRLHFTVEFPFPDAPDRLRIWQAVWPPATPLDPAIDLPLLAQRFELTGGNIRNIAVAAAFLAADADDQIVRMRDIVRATQREYQKTGKLIGHFDEFADGAGSPRH